MCVCVCVSHSARLVSVQVSEERNETGDAVCRKRRWSLRFFPVPSLASSPDDALRPAFHSVSPIQLVPLLLLVQQSWASTTANFFCVTCLQQTFSWPVPRFLFLLHFCRLFYRTVLGCVPLSLVLRTLSSTVRLMSCCCCCSFSLLLSYVF